MCSLPCQSLAMTLHFNTRFLRYLPDASTCSFSCTVIRNYTASQALGRDGNSQARMPLSDDCLFAIESLGVAAGGVRFDTPDSEERQKSVLREPVFLPLRLVTAHEMIQLATAESLVELDEKVRRPHVSVVLEYLVFKDQVIAKAVPREFRDEPMVLMQIVAIVGEDQVRLHSAPQFFEIVLDLLADVREEAVLEVLDDDLARTRARQEKRRALLRFPGALRIGTEDHPVKLQVRVVLNELENGSTAADLDVVAMCAQAQNSAQRLLVVI